MELPYVENKCNKTKWNRCEPACSLHVVKPPPVSLRMPILNMYMSCTVVYGALVHVLYVYTYMAITSGKECPDLESPIDSLVSMLHSKCAP